MDLSRWPSDWLTAPEIAERLLVQQPSRMCCRRGGCKPDVDVLVTDQELTCSSGLFLKDCVTVFSPLFSYG
jgi:hypothetical protein